MAEIYRNCMVCGKQFKACGTCHKTVPEELQWRRVVCCPQHFAYHLPIIRYVRAKAGINTIKNTIDNDDMLNEKTKKASTELETLKKELITHKAELKNAIETFGEIEFASDIKSIVDEMLST